jgi:hypothetical protein
MAKSTNQAGEVQPTPNGCESVPALLRDRMEFIRFKTEEDRRKAMGIFRKDTAGEILFTFRKDWPADTCITNTATVRALRQYGFAFEWLTENV